ncbi:hypothetical protein Gasu_18150 [Galdieria sulphuraria]|uniref:Uncharacterized protein n=1 Tax=Galdieria sulphuraria TaxID=130081 RepID=M2Y4M0_GALSU|nr:hypothetical protein Gasu_18150 [Galdieria sulphuraria]|eukprot:XP_005707314.1 hypothetical protein Gasu_18150 [Galdieria sulphuraria]
MGGGAWPFLVGGVICLVNSVNERDLFLLTSYIVFEDIRYILLRGTIRFSRMEVLGNNRGRRSRNKVSVGEPAEGSFTVVRYMDRLM